jgi:hypothetical protein
MMALKSAEVLLELQATIENIEAGILTSSIFKYT